MIGICKEFFLIFTSSRSDGHANILVLVNPWFTNLKVEVSPQLRVPTHKETTCEFLWSPQLMYQLTGPILYSKSVCRKSNLAASWISSTTAPSSGSGGGGMAPPSVPDKDYLLCASWHLLVWIMNFRALIFYFFKKFPALHHLAWILL